MILLKSITRPGFIVRWDGNERATVVVGSVYVPNYGVGASYFLTRAGVMYGYKRVSIETYLSLCK